MSRLPRITAKQLVAFLSGYGFVQVRQKGSHMTFRNDAGIRVTVPKHGAKILHPKIIKEVIERLELTVDEFIQRL